MTKRILTLMTFAILFWALPAGMVWGQDMEMTFVGVALDPETQKADQILRDQFQEHHPVKFEIRDMEYGSAIRTLVDWNVEEQGPVMARVTPYVHVVAEMLGADLEILGTYVSRKTQEVIYHSYLVVHRSTGLKKDDLDELVKYLRKRKTPARFIYHNLFSTSSYFLPSLYFQKTGIFSVKEHADNDRKYITIHAERPQNVSGSSDLVRKVKSGEADLAAVWDGTKNKFQNDPDLIFMKLPYALPNDLLVVSRSMKPEIKNKLRETLHAMKEDAINIGDFMRWDDFNKTPPARRALASLRWLAHVPPNPVPIKIRKPHQTDSKIEDKYLEAARQAIRLSGTEFVVYDEDFHKHFDVIWTLKKTHDDALVITSEFIHSDLPPQKFPISFKKDNMESLVLRIGAQITGKMHRIRYIWPFDTDHPRVLRDVEFSPSEGRKLKAVKITWNDTTSNDYIAGNPFEVTLKKSDFHSFEFEPEGFPLNESKSGLGFDPMDNTAYRVFLVQPTQKGRMFKIIAVAFIVLFSLAAIAACVSLIRKPKSNV